MGSAYEAVTLDVNFGATVNLARRAKSAGVKSFVFASSCSVYGASDDEPRTERSPVQPLTAYATSKVRAEEALSGLASAEFRVSCLRFATACGMSERLRLDLVLNDFVASAISTGQISVLSDGTPWRPLIDVQDMARAIEWASERPLEAGGSHVIVNVGSDEWNYRVRGLAEAVAAAIRGTRVSVNEAAPPDKRSYRVNFGLFRSLARSYVPQVTLVESVENLRDGLEAMRFGDSNFRQSILMRLPALADLQRRGLLDSQLMWSARPSGGEMALRESNGMQTKTSTPTLPAFH
jgi:nucleoside-diphosphate-sugar epimerase